MKIHWFSFSFEGENKGVCLVEANSREEAEDKAKNLGIFPENDDVAHYELEDLSKEIDLELNRLYSTEEMIEKGYTLRQSYN